MKTVVLAVIVALLVFAGFLAGSLLVPRTNTSSNLPEHLIITKVEYGVDPGGWIAVTINNTGIASINFAKLLVNNVKQSIVNPALPVGLAPDNGIVINATMSITAGEYQIDVLTSKGNIFSKLSSGPTMQEGVLLYPENVRFSTGATKVTVGNSGTENTRIVRVYLGDSAGNMTDVTAYSDIGSGKALNAGSTVTLTINWPNGIASTWDAGEYYHFRIVPTPGQFLEFQEQAPQ
jgi:hypothetical protein